jgi:hypothetical protein
MGPLPPFQVTVDAKGWSCILDVRLALSLHGLMAALRLAEEVKVFLVPTLWQVLDNTSFYERHPDHLAMEPLLPGGVCLGVDGAVVLPQWETARLELGLSALRVYWAGDAVHESSLPKEVDPGVVASFERLAEGLARRLTDVRPDLRAEDFPLTNGSRDAAALAAAMARYRPLILTVAGSVGDEPPLCRVLQACRIPCQRMETERAAAVTAQMVPLMARCGVLELIWAGLPLTAVHLVAPRSFLMTPQPGDADDLSALDAAREDGWQDAKAFWYPLP